jgi:hypothetical protein
VLLFVVCCVGEISRKVAADWVWLLTVFFIDCQVHELPALYAAWEIRGRCHITLQQQNHSQVGRPFLKIAWSVLECKFVWLGQATGLSTSYNNLLILAERYSYLNLNVTVVI